MKDNDLLCLSRKCYYVCVGTTIVFLIAWFTLQAFNISLTSIGPRPCVWYVAYGLYCPGCGGTRAVVSLMQGEFLRSFLYHPAVPYTVILVLMYMISHTLNLITRGKMKAMLFRGIYLYSILAVIIIQCIVKNVFVLWGSGYPYA